jgi:putative hydrolase of the HAD superfamily
VRSLPPVVLLDLDDTILDDTGAVAESWRRALAEEAPLLSRVDGDTLLETIDRHRVWYWSDESRHLAGRLGLVDARVVIVARALEELGLADPAAARRIAVAHTELRDAAIAPYPGAIDVLHALRASGRRLGLVSNGAADAQRAKVDRFELAPLFDYIGIEGEVGIGKPHPEAYQRAMRELGFAPGEACMVGDRHEWDVAAPMRLGLAGIWVDRAGVGLVEGATATLVVRSILELPTA